MEEGERCANFFRTFLFFGAWPSPVLGEIVSALMRNSFIVTVSCVFWRLFSERHALWQGLVQRFCALRRNSCSLKWFTDEVSSADFASDLNVLRICNVMLKYEKCVHTMLYIIVSRTDASRHDSRKAP